MNAKCYLYTVVRQNSMGKLSMLNIYWINKLNQRHQHPAAKPLRGVLQCLIIFFFLSNSIPEIQFYKHFQFISQNMVLKTLKSLIYQLDMFCSSELLRYNQQTQYKTLTGGLLSVGIICVIAGGFFNMIIDTLNRTSISSDFTITKHSNPPLAILSPGPETMFMMGLQIQSTDQVFNADLNNGIQYFTIRTTITQFNNGVYGTTETTLEPCTREHWSMMPDFLAGFDNFGVAGWLCLPLRVPILLQGTYTSAVNKETIFRVYPCQNTTDFNNCAPQEDIDRLFEQRVNFYFAVNYINPVINPNKPEFMSYYIEGHDYVIFSKNIGAEAWIQFTDYTITSDNSIWPFSDFTIDKGCIVQQKATNHPYGVSQGAALGTIIIAKSLNSLAINREVQKISAVFSYIGGLVGAITALLFLVKSYTDSSLEISIGIKLFQEEGGPDNQDQENFNIIGYIRLTFYRLIKFFGWKKVQEYSERLEHYQQEAARQLDVGLLLKRLIKLQTCIEHLLTPDQLTKIRDANPITMMSAKKMRSLLLIQQAKQFDDVESAADMSGKALKQKQYPEKQRQQNSNSKPTSDLLASIYKRHSVDMDQENIKRDKRQKQVQLASPIIIRPQGEAYQDNSKRNILKKVKMVVRDENVEDDHFEALTPQPMDTHVRFQKRT